MTVTTVRVSGMTCSHCVSAVSAGLQGVDGVHDVAIDLVVGGTSTITLTSDAPLDDAAVAAAVDEAGYELADD